jgi:Na+/proline symporter
MSIAKLSKFSVIDYVLLIFMFAFSMCIGLFFGCIKDRKEPTTSKDLWLANHKMNILPTALSLTASYFSGLSVLGYPFEAYAYGTMFIWTSKNILTV